MALKPKLKKNGIARSTGSRLFNTSWEPRETEKDAYLTYLSKPHRELTGGEKLQYACMIDALHNLYSPHPEVRQEAEKWISSESNHLFSFRTCCEVFNLTPSVVREAMKHNKWDYRAKRFRVKGL